LAEFRRENPENPPARRVGTLATYIGKCVRLGKMRDAAALLGVLFEANIKWISSRLEPRPFVLSS
jgi:hypothetical protein